MSPISDPFPVARMSSKKARRKKRQQQEEDRDRSRRSLGPVTLFLLGIGVAVLLTAVASVVLVDRSGRGDPPWPGAVWSAAHGHWH